MNVGWSDQQRRCLHALGYTLYRSATSVDAHTAEVTIAVDNAPVAVAVGRVPLEEGRTIAARQTIDPLARALLHAAALDPARCGDIAAWLREQQIPSLTQLRNNPAAKRALWPRLRALRRSRSTG